MAGTCTGSVTWEEKLIKVAEKNRDSCQTLVKESCSLGPLDSGEGFFWSFSLSLSTSGSKIWPSFGYTLEGVKKKKSENSPP